jgi:hypothetical protein
MERHTGMAFVFDKEGSFFNVPMYIDKIEISYYANEKMYTNILEIIISIEAVPKLQLLEQLP